MVAIKSNNTIFLAIMFWMHLQALHLLSPNPLYSCHGLNRVCNGWFIAAPAFPSIQWQLHKIINQWHSAKLWIFTIFEHKLDRWWWWWSWWWCLFQANRHHYVRWWWWHVAVLGFAGFCHWQLVFMLWLSSGKLHLDTFTLPCRCLFGGGGKRKKMKKVDEILPGRVSFKEILRGLRVTC